MRMNTEKISKHTARAVRDMILHRSEWIVNSSIRASCGYIPQLPPDLIDFTSEDSGQRMVPEMKHLSDLLRAVAPVMKLEDDRQSVKLTPKQKVRKEIADKADAVYNESQAIIDKCASGQLSSVEGKAMLELRIPLLEMAARRDIINAIEDLN